MEEGRDSSGKEMMGMVGEEEGGVDLRVVFVVGLFNGDRGRQCCECCNCWFDSLN